MQDQEWKKRAAQALANQDVEKAFLDQAYVQLANRCGPIMKSPYKVGFEIVYKNDDSTRMVGIFVFRLRKDDLVYAPVFFIAGQIKGTDLLYRHGPKTFVPLTPDWTDYLLHRAPSPEGEGVPPSVRQQANNHQDLVSIIEPPKFRKLAASEKAAALECLNQMAEQVKSASREGSLLRKFIEEDGGYNSIQKIAKAAKDSYEFANALFMNLDEDDFAPRLEVIEKQASAPLLVIHRDLLSNPNVKSASVDQLSEDMVIEDNRKEASVNTVTYAPEEECVEAVGEPGVYKVLMADGGRQECLVAYSGPDMLDVCHQHDPHPSYPALSPSSLRRQTPMAVVRLSDNACTTSCGYHPVYGEFVKDINESDKFLDKPVSGKGYRIYDSKKRALSDPIWVCKTGKSPAGLDSFTTGCNWGMDQEWSLNPDYDGQLDHDHVLGKRYKFVEIPAKKEDERVQYPDGFQLGSTGSIDKWVMENGFKRASVHRDGEEFTFKRVPEDKWSPRLTKQAMKIALMNECDLSEPAAQDALDGIGEQAFRDFLYEPKRDEAEKQATNLAWRQFPEFYSQFNQDFGVPQEDYDTMRTSITAQANRPIQPRHRVGDRLMHEAHNDDSPSGQNGPDLNTAAPNELYMFSQMSGAGSVFEHGVVGSLVKTYDSIGLVEKYLPDLEQALDRLGRIIFLLYWKPEDFIKAYGSDDQADLENKLLSNFKALGELTLELLMKSQHGQQGTSALT